MVERAETSELTSSNCSAKLGEDIALAKNFDFDAFDFDVRSAVFSEQDFVADCDRHFSAVATFQQTAWANCRDFATLRFFASSIRQDDSTSCFFFSIDRLDNNAIIKRFQSHR